MRRLSTKPVSCAGTGYKTSGLVEQRRCSNERCRRASGVCRRALAPCTVVLCSRLPLQLRAAVHDAVDGERWTVDGGRWSLGTTRALPARAQRYDVQQQWAQSRNNGAPGRKNSSQTRLKLPRIILAKQSLISHGAGRPISRRTIDPLHPAPLHPAPV